MAKTTDYKASDPVHLTNKHKRIVAVRADQVAEKVATGYYQWPLYERMNASEVKDIAESIPGLKYETKEKTIDAINARAGAILKHQAETPRAEGGHFLDPIKQVRDHPNYAIARSAIERLLGLVDMELEL